MTQTLPDVTFEDIVYNSLVKRAGETLWAETGITCPQCRQPFLVNQPVSMRPDYLSGDNPLHCYVHTACAEAHNNALINAEYTAYELPPDPPTTVAKSRIRDWMFTALVDVHHARRMITDNPTMSPAGINLWQHKELEAQVLMSALGNALHDLEEWNHDE